jgi:hypothetical protein
VEQRILGAGATQHLGIKAAGQAQPGARPGDLLARRWASTSWPGSTRSTSSFHRAAGGLFAVQPCLDDPGVVEDQQVTAPAAGGQSGNAVHRQSATAVEQARCAALGGRVLSDQLGRQVKSKSASV